MSRMEDRGYVFVYGTLREGFTNAGRRVLGEGAEPVGEGCVVGGLYDAGSFPVLVADEEGAVVGEVYRLHRPGAGLARLDRYEGVGGSGSFERRLVLVDLTEGDRLEAWAYVWTGSVSGFDRVPGGDFVAYVEA